MRRSSAPNAGRQLTPAQWRDRLGLALAVATFASLCAAFIFSGSMHFLSPGPLTSAHGAIESCGTCHTTSGTSKLGWIAGLFEGDPEADSNACLTCHKMSDTAFNPHSTNPQVLEQSTQRLVKIAAQIPAPYWTSTQSSAFPTHDMAARGLYCSTCHREHKGSNVNLAKITNEQCQACHVVKFDSFDGNHPSFDNYPFKQRTPIIYDHSGHTKHFSDTAKKDPAKRVPTTCADCHNDRADRRRMAVASFEQTCSSCHIGQITGKERVSGPKGVAFLSVPGLDLQTLREKVGQIGEWPSDSEAELTPFMKVMISRSERGRELIRAVDRLNLQDLTDASDDQVQAVAELMWEIKGVFYALIAGKASDVLGNLNFGCGAKLSPNLIADLTASIPRDVVISAQQQWLPNLGVEMASRPPPSAADEGCWIGTVGGWVTAIAESGLAAQQTKAKNPASAAPKTLQIDAQGGLVKPLPVEAIPLPAKAAAGTAQPAAAPPARQAPPSAAAAPPPPQGKGADQTDDLLNLTEEEQRGLKGAPAVRGYLAYAGSEVSNEKLSATELPSALKADVKDTGVGEADARDKGIKGRVRVAQADGGRRAPAGGGQSDELLSPSDEELQGLPPALREALKASRAEGSAGRPDVSKAQADIAASAAAKPPEKAPPLNAPASPAAPRAAAAPAASGPPAQSVISIQSSIEPESWAEYGGWYRQDFTIFYRPTGHKDKFIYSWLFLTGPQTPKGDRSPASAVFESLSGKDAQGVCTKCHSVDDIRDKGRMVNFSPPLAKDRQGRFTRFVHEPHFGILEHRGCLTCHSLEKGSRYLQSYEQGNPKVFAPAYSAVKKELCQSCHTSGMARQDCLLCHKYHLDGVTTPMMTTRIPTE